MGTGKLSPEVSTATFIKVAIWAADAIKLWDILQFRNLNKNAVFFRPFQWLPQNKNAYPLVI